MNLRLDDKYALVCGGSGGIGLGIAERFAAMGATVTILSRSEDKLQAALKQLNSDKDQEHNYISVDTADHTRLTEKVKEMIGNGYRYTILVNNSGGPAPGRLIDENPEKLQAAFAGHVIAAQLLAKILVPLMTEEHYGRIINVISMSVKTPIDNLGVSNTTRGAMASWSKTLAKELAGRGITVNNLLPGNILTTRLESLIGNNAKAQGVPPAEVAKAMKAAIPAGDFGKPEDMGYAAGFLASEEASYITGISLPVDGGKIPCL